jgi:hypothetical protein
VLTVVGSIIASDDEARNWSRGSLAFLWLAISSAFSSQSGGSGCCPALGRDAQGWQPSQVTFDCRDGSIVRASDRSGKSAIFLGKRV